MADPLEQLNVIGQKALAVPTELLSVGARRMTEDMGIFSSKIQDIGSTLILPAGGLSLPQLPGLPGLPGAESAAAAPPAATRSERVQGMRATRKTSYLKV
jgi:hypothetical protein